MCQIGENNALHLFLKGIIPKKVKVKMQIKGIAPCLAFSYSASVDLHLFFCLYLVQLVATSMYIFGIHK